MATANELLAALTNSEEERVLIIDNDLRTIIIPKIISTLGVEADGDVHRLHFRMPRMYGTTDLSEFNIRINYMNARGMGDIYVVTDKNVLTSSITFSWLVGPNALAYKGNVKFIVCLKESDTDGNVLREFNTTVASLPVLEGLEVDASSLSGKLVDVLEQLQSLTVAKVAEVEAAGTAQIAKVQEESSKQQTNIVEKGKEVLATIPEDYQTTTKLAEEAVRSKADAIICSADGEDITVADSSDDNLRGLKIFGMTTQITTTGAQLAYVNINVPGYAYYGVTSSATEDGNILINGTATDRLWNRHVSAELTAGETYTLSSNSTIALAVWDAIANTEYAIKIAGSKSITFVAQNTGTYAIVLCNEAGSTLSNVRANIMLNAGDTALPWEPYTGGKPSPSPEYPQELVSIENPTVDIYGKNLLNITATTQTSNGITFTVNDDKTIVINGTATADAYCGLTQPDVLHPGKYILSGCTDGSSNTYFLYTDTGAIYNRDSEVEFTIDTPSEKKFLIKVHSGVTVNNTMVKPMLRLAEIVDNVYEVPIEAQTVALNERSLPGIPVTSGGNYTDENGQQWICDEIDFERGVYVQRINEISLPSTFVVNENTNEMWIQLPDNEAAGYNTTDVQCICTHFPGTSRQEVYDHAFEEDYCGIAARDRFVRVIDNIKFKADPEVLNEWINERITAGDPVILKYILATPIETPLTADELATFQALKSNYPNTTVLNDAGAWMNLRYNADTETWITNLIDEKIAAAVAKL